MAISLPSSLRRHAYIAICATIVACFGRPSDLNAKDLSDQYSWKPMKVGGGGWVVGMDIHPTEKDLRYVRADVSGGYRWDAATSSWKQLVTATSMPKEYVGFGKFRGVDSLVSAPADPNIAYMAYGGQIFRSTNRGDIWASTAFAANNVKMEPNGDGRQEGERLGVDPNNSNVVYYCSIADGLWTTVDAGASWKKVSAVPPGTAPHGVNTIVFDKKPGTVPVTVSGTGGAGSGKSGNGEIRTKSIYVTVDQVGVFMSPDGGATWANIADGGPKEKPNIRDAETGSDGTYYVVCDNANGAVGSVWKRTAEGKWKDITPAGESGGSKSYWDIAVDPYDAQHLVVMCSGGVCFDTKDQGATWNPHSFYLKSPKIDWLQKQENYWLSVGEIAFDPSTPGQLWFAEGFGVWKTGDLTPFRIEWESESAGIEEACGNDVIAPPGGKPVAAAWDVGVFRFENPDTYTATRPIPYFMSAWALDYCPGDPKFIAAVFRNHLGFEPHVNESGFSTDGGLTWTMFPSVKGKTSTRELEYGIISVSANSPDKIVWAPADSKLPYYTTDRGTTWKQSSFPADVTDTGHDIHFSPQRYLCADRVRPDTFYFYHVTAGFFRSEDGGATFTNSGGSPPEHLYNSIMKAVPQYDAGAGKSSGGGQILFAEGYQENQVGGLWHSEDAGATWKQYPFIEQAFNFALGKSKEKGGFPAIYVAGVAKGETGIYRSVDSGATWDKIASYPLGIFDSIDAMDADKDEFGKVYLAFTYTGFVYGAEVKAP